MLKMYAKIKPSFYGNANKINKFSETIISEIIQITFPATFLKSQNRKNIPIHI